MRRSKKAKKTSTRSSQILGKGVGMLEQIQAFLSSESEEFQAQLSEITEQILGLSPDDASFLLKKAARELGNAAIPLLLSLLESPTHGMLAVESLGFTQSENAVPILQKLVQENQPKEIVKSARRALYHLKNQGIHVEESPQSPLNAKPTSQTAIRRAFASYVDEEGTQMLGFYVFFPATGPEYLSGVGNDTEGIISFSSQPYTKRKLQGFLNHMESKGLKLLEVPSSHVINRLMEFVAIGSEIGNPLPPDYQVYKRFFDAQISTPNEVDIYNLLDIEAISSQPELAERAREYLLSEKIIPWIIPPREIEQFGLRTIEAEESHLLLPKAAEEERKSRIVNEAIRFFFDESGKARYKRRLEENAYLLAIEGNKDLARIAFACALQLGSDKDVTTIEFAQALVNISLEYFQQTQKREQRITPVGAKDLFEEGEP